MSLKHAILGFLNNSPKTGYDLQKKIATTISHFWPSTQSQIYRTLSEMAQEGLIVPEIHYQDEKPNKKIYTITPEGNRELMRWLSTPLDISSHRNQFLVQLFFSRNIDRANIIANLKHYKREMEKRKGFLNSPEVKSMLLLSDKAIEKSLFEIIRDNGMRLLKSESDWVDKSVKLLESIDGGGGK